MAKIGNVLALPLKIFDTVAIKAAPAGKSKAARQGSFDALPLLVRQLSTQ